MGKIISSFKRSVDSPPVEVDSLENLTLAPLGTVPSPPNILGSAPPMFQGSAPLNVRGSSPPNILGSAPPNVQGSAPPTVQGGAPLNVRGSSPPNILGSAPPNVKGSAPPNIIGSAPPNVQSSGPPIFQGSSPPDIQESATPDVLQNALTNAAIEFFKKARDDSSRQNPLANSQPFSLSNCTDEQIRGICIHFTLEQCNTMAQDFVQVKLEKVTKEKWQDNKLWEKWASQNLEKIKTCQFSEKLETVTDSSGNEIPSLSSMDISFLHHLLNQIDNRDKASFPQLVDLRNKHSHKTKATATSNEFQTFFSELFKITESLFKKNKPLANKWKEKFNQLKNLDFQQIAKDDLAKRFQAELKDLIIRKTAMFTVPGSEKQLSIEKVSIYPSLKTTKYSTITTTTTNKTDENVKRNEALSITDKRPFPRNAESQNTITSKEDDNYKELLDSDNEDKQDVEYESPEEDETNDDNKLYQLTNFDSMLDIIKSCVIKDEKDRIVIAAGGGRGKTLSSKKLMYEWAKRNYLQWYFAVIRIDMKEVESHKTLFENMLSQYSGLQSQFQNDLLTLKEIFNQKQDKILWLIDSLDESKYQTGAMKFIRESQSFYSKSAFIFLTRPEGKSVLNLEGEEMTEFRINDLSEEKVKELVNKFPFTQDSERKKLQILDECKASKKFFSWMQVPLYTVAYCALVDAGLLTQKIKTVLDILFALVAMAMKSGELKMIKIRWLSSNIFKGQYTEEKTKILRTNFLKDIVQKDNRLLTALGKAVFICNGNSLHGFASLKEDELKSLLTKEDLNSVLRLSTYEQILDEQVIETISVFKFYHRNLRELILSYYLTRCHEPLEAPTTTQKLTDSVLSTFRCTVAILRSTQNENKERVGIVIRNVVRHITGHGTEMNDWRLGQIICELIQFALMSPEYSQIIANTLTEIFPLIEDSSRLSPLKLINPIPLFDCLRLHMDITLCKDCKIPKGIKLYFEKLQSLVLDPNRLNWPDVNIFKIGRLLINTEDLLILALTEEGNPHLTEESPVIKIRAPVKTTTGFKSNPSLTSISQCQELKSSGSEMQAILKKYISFSKNWMQNVNNSEKITESCNQYSIEDSYQKDISLTLVGDSKAGKTTIGLFLAKSNKENEIQSKYNQTEVLDIYYAHLKSSYINIIDIGGETKFQPVFPIVCRERSMYAIVIDGKEVVKVVKMIEEQNIWHNFLNDVCWSWILQILEVVKEPHFCFCISKLDVLTIENYEKTKYELIRYIKSKNDHMIGILTHKLKELNKELDFLVSLLKGIDKNDGEFLEVKKEIEHFEERWKVAFYNRNNPPRFHTDVILGYSSENTESMTDFEEKLEEVLNKTKTKSISQKLAFKYQSLKTDFKEKFFLTFSEFEEAEPKLDKSELSMLVEYAPSMGTLVLPRIHNDKIIFHEIDKLVAIMKSFFNSNFETILESFAKLDQNVTIDKLKEWFKNGKLPFSLVESLFFLYIDSPNKEIDWRDFKIYKHKDKKIIEAFEVFLKIFEEIGLLCFINALEMKLLLIPSLIKRNVPKGTPDTDDQDPKGTHKHTKDTGSSEDPNDPNSDQSKHKKPNNSDDESSSKDSKDFSDQNEQNDPILDQTLEFATGNFGCIFYQQLMLSDGMFSRCWGVLFNFFGKLGKFLKKRIKYNNWEEGLIIKFENKIITLQIIKNPFDKGCRMILTITVDYPSTFDTFWLLLLKSGYLIQELLPTIDTEAFLICNRIEFYCDKSKHHGKIDFGSVLSQEQTITKRYRDRINCACESPPDIKCLFPKEIVQKISQIYRWSSVFYRQIDFDFQNLLLVFLKEMKPESLNNHPSFFKQLERADSIVRTWSHFEKYLGNNIKQKKKFIETFECFEKNSALFFRNGSWKSVIDEEISKIIEINNNKINGNYFSITSLCRNLRNGISHFDGDKKSKEDLMNKVDEYFGRLVMHCFSFEMLFIGRDNIDETLLECANVYSECETAAALDLDKCSCKIKPSFFKFYVKFHKGGDILFEVPILIDPNLLIFELKEMIIKRVSYESFDDKQCYFPPELLESAQKKIHEKFPETELKHCITIYDKSKDIMVYLYHEATGSTLLESITVNSADRGDIILEWTKYTIDNCNNDRIPAFDNSFEILVNRQPISRKTVIDRICKKNQMDVLVKTKGEPGKLTPKKTL